MLVRLWRKYAHDNRCQEVCLAAINDGTAISMVRTGSGRERGEEFFASHIEGSLASSAQVVLDYRNSNHHSVSYVDAILGRLAQAGKTVYIYGLTARSRVSVNVPFVFRERGYAVGQGAQFQIVPVR